MNTYVNGEYYYYNTNGELVSIPSNNVNNYTNYKNNYPDYEINNNVDILPEPEITNAHQIPYQGQYKNNDYFSNDYNLYKANININNNGNNYYKQNERIIYTTQNNISNNYLNNYTQVTPTNNIQKAQNNIFPIYDQKNEIYFPKKNITNNIDNNLGINVKIPNYLSNQTNGISQNKNQINPNHKISKPQTQINFVPHNYKNILTAQRQDNIVNNNIKNNNYIPQEQNRQILQPEQKIIPIQKNIKKENIISDKNFNYKNINVTKMPSPPNNNEINNLIKENNNMTKVVQNNLAQIQNKNININNNNNIIKNDNQDKQIIQKNQNNNIVGNKIKEIDNKNIENKEKGKIIEKQPSDNASNRLIEEVTEGINNIEIIPQKPIEDRPLTKEDYNNIFMRGIGIINLGNTCFINSCLQALIHCKLFMQTFFNASNKIKEETTPISYNFLLICILMLDISKKTGQKYIDISYFKYIFGKKHPIFNGYNQNDSQEFCRIFLEDLSAELNEAKNKNLYRALTNTANKTKSFRDKEFDLNFKDREKSIITDLFYSQIITSFTCKCGNEIYSFQKLLDFPLLLPENAKSVNINDLFKIYFKAEEIEFETKCEKCNKIEKHKKEMKISRPPQILIISLQRINEVAQKKNECLVVFPDVLNLFDFIDHDLKSSNDNFYQLFAIINHQGNMSGGHYYTFIKPLKSQNWYEFNDSIVRQIKIDKNIFPFAYALFYIKNSNQ